MPEYEVLFGLQMQEQRLFGFIHRACQSGIYYDDIMEAMYGDTEVSPNVLSVMKTHMTPKLQKHGLRITCKRGPSSLWRIEKFTK